MQKYICDLCGWVYDPELGDPDNGESWYSICRSSGRLGLSALRSCMKISHRLTREI